MFTAYTGGLILLSWLLCVQLTFALERDDPVVERLIRRYWHQYRTIAVILAYMRTVHHVRCGLTWLKKKLKQLGLVRRGSTVQYSAIPDVQAAVEKELQGCHSNIGYRQLWRVLQTKHGLVVKRSTVQMLLSILDPEGAKRRKGRRLRRRIYQNKIILSYRDPIMCGTWMGTTSSNPTDLQSMVASMDDWFSRRVIWLHLASTNNDPRVILQHYLLAVLECEGCPVLLRSDKGTENSILAACHMAMRHHHDDDLKGEKSFRYGASTTNTRIESWWAQLRNSLTDWWMNLFKDLVQQGKLNPNNTVHRHTLSYVYGTILSESLEEYKQRWNMHRIRPNRLAGCPSGSPNDLYFLPEMKGTHTYKKELDYDVWIHSYLEHAQEPCPLYPTEFEVAAAAILERDFDMTRQDITLENAEIIFLHLVQAMSP